MNLDCISQTVKKRNYIPELANKQQSSKVLLSGIYSKYIWGGSVNMGLLLQVMNLSIYEMYIWLKALRDGRDCWYMLPLVGLVQTSPFLTAIYEKIAQINLS